MYSNEEFILPCINAMLYVFLLAYAIMRRHGILIMISAIWLLCAVIGIIYSLIPFTQTNNDITFAPYLYLFVLIMIGLLPISMLRPIDGKELKVVYNEGIVYGIVVVLAVCSFIPLLESLIQIAFSGLDNLASIYEERPDDFDTRAYFSFIGRIFYSVEDYFEFLTPTFFFVYVTMFKEKKMWIVIGLVVALLNPLFNNLANGQRYYAVVFVYMILYNYLLFYKMIDEQQRKFLGQLALIIGGIMGLLFVSISLNRTTDGTEELGAAYGFVRYMGESMYNFNTDCYWITDYVGGEQSLKGFYSYLGIDNTSIEDRSSLLGIVSNNFYTYIGAFVMDFGLIFTFIFLSLVALLFYILISKLDKEVNIGILIIISLYANILLFGTTYFIYENGFIHFVWAILLSVFLLFAEVDNYESTET
ncbi:MAG: oligosaccharide repeat unit polymerase [Prevotella sp.]|nr:oligosaccharide repeat unit polymerase [Prevotella sp.]